MIKFFRKIRQNLLTANKFSKYLLYAVGEIILVVLGILIALYLNNQNLNRQTEEKIDILLSEVLLDLDYIIKDSDRQLKFYYDKEVLFDLILNDQLSYDDYESDKYPTLSIATIWYSKGQKRKIGYSNLTKEINAIPEKYKSIMDGLNSLYNSVSNEKYRDIIEEMSNANLKNRADNYEWFSSMVPDSQNKEMIDFMLTDYRYKNEVKHYGRIVFFHIGYIIYDKIKAEKLYKDIATFLDKPVNHTTIYDKETASMLIGNWKLENYADLVLTIYEENSQLHYKISQDTFIFDIHFLSKDILYESEGSIIKFSKDNKENININGLDFTKVKE